MKTTLEMALEIACAIIASDPEGSFIGAANVVADEAFNVVEALQAEQVKRQRSMR